MAEMVESRKGEYTKDGTVDIKGNPILRSKRGGWTACSFVVAYKDFERIACHIWGYPPTWSSTYLTTKLHRGIVKSADNVTNWVGTDARCG